jgi:hypothetical protein
MREFRVRLCPWVIVAVIDGTLWLAMVVVGAIGAVTDDDGTWRIGLLCGLLAMGLGMYLATTRRNKAIIAAFEVGYRAGKEEVYPPGPRPLRDRRATDA